MWRDIRHIFGRRPRPIRQEVVTGGRGGGPRWPSPLRCSFCGKSRDQVKRLIAGQRDIAICSECVALCHEMIEGHKAPG
jgi:hypothetical protein